MPRKTYRWYIAITKGGATANKAIYDHVGADETKFHRDAPCQDADNKPVRRDLIEVTRAELRTIRDSAESLKLSFESYVQEGTGSIRFFDSFVPKQPKLKKEKKDSAAMHGGGETRPIPHEGTVH
ncbi:MAG TPA: hypothetical protein VFT82_01690 [Candidatus Paceibacterota bacterium]|nr:hypothetical protein [Candidatus Paceibacterota bacterium]